MGDTAKASNTVIFKKLIAISKLTSKSQSFIVSTSNN